MMPTGYITITWCKCVAGWTLYGWVVPLHSCLRTLREWHRLQHCNNGSTTAHTKYAAVLHRKYVYMCVFEGMYAGMAWIEADKCEVIQHMGGQVQDVYGVLQGELG